MTIPLARQPRGAVRLNGELMTGWVSFDVDNNSFYQADTFRVVFAVTALPKDKGADWFAKQTSIECEILAGFPKTPDSFNPEELKVLIFGKVDDINYNPATFEIELSGRDLTSAFIDAKTTEKFQNLTSSKIVEQIASRRGLKPVVTPTKTVVGTYYQIDHADISEQRTEWDLLTYLAAKEQYSIFVSGKELHFSPLPSATDTPYLLKWEQPTKDHGFPIFNGKSIAFSHSLTLSKGVAVTVRSWNQKQKKGFTVYYPHKPKDSDQAYSFTVPNKTHEEALQIAQTKHKEITKHEIKVMVELPGDNDLTISSVLKVEGTLTDFDQIYYVDSVTRQMSFNEGYTMAVNGKNIAHGSVNNE